MCPDMKKAPEVGVLHTVRPLCYLHDTRFPLDVNHFDVSAPSILVLAIEAQGICSEALSPPLAYLSVVCPDESFQEID